MAHTSFDVFPGTVSVLDNQTAMAVQSLLESQAAASAESTSSASILESVINASLDEDDVFQCGKCKKQFSSLIMFVSHKREPCMPLNGALTATSISSTAAMTMNTTSMHSMNVACSSIPTAISFNPNGDLGGPQSLHQPVSATYTTVSSSSLPQVVLNEADLLSLTALDHQTLTIPVHSTSATASYLTQLTPVTAHPPLSAAQPVMVPIQQSSSISHCNMNNTAIFTMAAMKTMPLLAKALSSNRIENDEESSLRTQLSGSMERCSSQINVVESKEKGAHCKRLHDEAPITYSIIAEMQPSTPTESVADVVLEANGEEPVIQEIVPTTKTRKRGKASGSKVDTAAKKVNKLQCLYCDKGFAKNFDLQQHIRAHTGEKPFQCIVCGRAFAQKSNVKKHMQTHKVWPNGISNTLRSVNLCAGSSSGGPENDAVDASDDQQPTIIKGLRRSSFVDEATSKDQNEKENADAPSDENSKEPPVVIDSSYICQFCNQSFKTYCHLKTHLKEHKNEQVYKCILKSCGQVFQELDTFLEHTKAHETEMSYWCHVCSKLFRSLYELGLHQYSHSMFPEHEPKQRETKYYHCTRCMNKYSTPAALERHMETTSHSFECQHCKKVFPSERYLRRHLPTHCSQSLHMCSVCLKGFKTEHYLRMHLLIHSGDKPFQCQQCQASFNRKDKLKRHMLIHESVKRFKCPFRAHTGCTKEFHRPDKLKAHVITHSGIRPFKCRQCNRAFSRRAHLREHQQLHNETADCKFVCVTCGNGFLDETKLKEHACDLAPPSPTKRRRTSRASKGRSSLPRKAASRTSARKSKAQTAKNLFPPEATMRAEKPCDSQKKLVILEVEMPPEGTDQSGDTESQTLSSNQLCELRLSIALDDPLGSYGAQSVHQEMPGAADAGHMEAGGNHERTYADFGTLQSDLLLDNASVCGDSTQDPGSMCAMVVSGQNVLLTLSNVMDSGPSSSDIVSHLSEM